jgi:hypothetical protein
LENPMDSIQMKASIQGGTSPTSLSAITRVTGRASIEMSLLLGYCQGLAEDKCRNWQEIPFQ